MAVLALLSLVATACGSDSEDGGENPSASQELSTEPLRLVVAAEPSTFNPVLTLYSTLRIVGPMFDPLVGIDKETLEPNDTGLLTEWERVSPTEWRFTVREGVKFHNGEPWDAAAAAFTIEKYRDEPASGFAPYYKRVVSATAESPTSLLVTTNGPYIAMPLVLTTAMGVPPAHYAQVTGEGFSAQPVGTGPFKFESAQSGQSLSLTANEDYWQGAPDLAGITYSWAGDAATRAALLQSGGADLVADLPNELLEDVENAPGTTVLNARSLYKMALHLNTNQGTLADVNLREAVQHAIDYDALVETLFGGVGAQASPYFTGDVMPEPPELDYHEYDPDRARELVKAAGGTPKLRYLYTTGFYPKDSQVGEAVSAMLEDVGFEVEQVPLENTELRKQRNTGDYSLYMVQIFPVFAHPDSFFAFFTGTNAAVKYCTDVAGYDKLQTEALTTDDVDASYETYAEMEKKILDEDRCNVILYDQVNSYGLSDRVQGFEPALDGVPNMYTVSLLKG